MSKLDNPPPEQQLLVCEPVRQHPTVVVDHEEIKEKRRLMYWVVKVFVMTISTTFLATVLSMIYVLIIRGDPLHQGILGSFLSTMVEMVKIISQP